MNFTEYQIEAQKTAIYPRNRQTDGLVYCTLGLAGEAGEVANKVKKVLRDTDDGMLLDDVADAIMGELGDVLWYLAMTAAECGWTLNEVAQVNLDKLRSRKERGKLGGSGDTR